MKKLSIMAKSSIANNKSRRCLKCVYLNACDELACKVCVLNFRKGFIKGYQQAKKELSSNT